MAQSDHDGEVAGLQAVSALAAGEVVVGEAHRLARALGRERVEEEAMRAGDLIEPVVLGVARRLPAAVGGVRS
jgi:hypothetical protein